jgi:curved DNA-binding protein CbpA
VAAAKAGVSVPDPYKILQVDPEAEDEVIEAAYKRLARKYHPDVSPDPASVERMVRINQAWEMLRDPTRRAAVDRARARAVGTSARVVAADGKAYAGSRPSSGARRSGAPRPSSGGPWPFPGVQDPGAATTFTSSARPASANWTPGRSTEGSTGYDTRAAGTGSAGPPPGNPSGSLVTFGRYDGWTIGEIARTDPEYLEWLDRMPIGRTYQAEIDALLRKQGRRLVITEPERAKGMFRRR